MVLALGADILQMEGDWKCPESHIQSEHWSLSWVCGLQTEGFLAFLSDRSVDGSIVSTVVINRFHGVRTAHYSAPSFQYHLKQRHLPQLGCASVSLEKSISCFNFPAVFL